MNKVKKQSYPPINMGISFMLVIFTILTMTVFAVLSLSTAKKDFDYSKRNAELTTAYYNACNLAEEELFKISSDPSNFINNDFIEFYVDVNESQALYVVAELHAEDYSYTIKTWKLISTFDWEGDDSLSVIGSKH